MSTASFKENIRKYYNQEAELRDSKSVKADWKIEVREKFCDIIKQEGKNTLLELGAGAGYDSQFFANSGLTVTAVDISSEMVKKCAEKGINAVELDFYNLSSLETKFDCIYAINTLLHIPKTDLPHVLNEINLVLNDNGLFYMGVYGGEDTESEFVKSEVSEFPRLFSFHSKEQLQATLDSYFQILSFDSLNISNNTEIAVFHSVIMRKK